MPDTLRDLLGVFTYKRGDFIMAVMRIHKTRDYTVMSNAHFREREMSLKAKGLLSLMFSLPDDWDYSIAGLVAICKENETAINSTLKELKRFGYLSVTKLYPNETESGRIEYVYDIFETPQKKDFLKEEKQGVENQGVENRGQLNTKKSKTKNLNTNNQNNEEEERKKGEPKRSSYDVIVGEKVKNEEVKKTLFEYIKMRKLIKKPLTDFALRELIAKLEKLATEPTEQVEILKKSIVGSYLDIFPLKEDKQPAAHAASPAPAAGKMDEDDKLLPIKGNVLLSENQIADLLDKMGLQAFDYYLDKLSLYIEDNGSVIGHYATMLKWYYEDSKVAQ